ncbi:MAG: S41 family peptidase [Bacteroidota bacterium]
MKKLLPFALLFVVCFTSCSDDEDDSSDFSSERNLLRTLLSIGENESINRLIINWTEARERVFRIHEQDSYEAAIIEFLTILDDNHSRYIPTTGEDLLVRNVSCEGQEYSFNDLPDNVGYVRVDSFLGSGNEAQMYAEDIQRRISEQDNEDLIGWIVDLSDNIGGNMYPMIAGLGPFFTDDTLGYFIDPLDNAIAWGYAQDASFINETIITRVQNPYQLLDPSKPVAVISSTATTSSGEATLISFIDRPNTRIFGSPSCGLSTVNTGRELSNGDRLIITTSTMADRNMNVYGVSIIPDETIIDPSELNTRVIEWLAEQ